MRVTPSNTTLVIERLFHNYGRKAEDLDVKKGTDKILGATLVARHTGEMISEITLAMVAGDGLGTLSKAIHPYPSQAEAIKKAGDAHSRTRLTPRVRLLFEMLLRWRR